MKSQLLLEYPFQRIDFYLNNKLNRYVMRNSHFLRSQKIQSQKKTHFLSRLLLQLVLPQKKTQRQKQGQSLGLVTNKRTYVTLKYDISESSLLYLNNLLYFILVEGI